MKYAHLLEVQEMSEHQKRISSYVIFIATVFTILSVLFKLPLIISVPLLMILSTPLFSIIPNSKKYRQHREKLGKHELERLETLLKHINEINSVDLMQKETHAAAIELQEYRKRPCKNPPFYRVTDPKSKSELYILGTIHVIPLTAYPDFAIQKIKQMINDPNTLFFSECPPPYNDNRLLQVFSGLKTIMSLIKLKHLYSLWFLDKNVNSSISVFLNNAGRIFENHNPGLHLLFNLSNPYLTLLLTARLMFPTFGFENATDGNGTDFELLSLRIKANLMVNALETKKEASHANGITFFEKLTRNEILKEFEILISITERIKRDDLSDFFATLRNELRSMTKQIVTRYQEGHSDENILPNCLTSHPAAKIARESSVIKNMIEETQEGATARTLLWWPKIRQALSSKKRIFLAAGDAHLVGPGSLLNFLGHEGYQIERIAEDGLKPQLKLEEISTQKCILPLSQLNSRIPASTMEYYRNLKKQQERASRNSQNNIDSKPEDEIWITANGTVVLK